LANWQGVDTEEAYSSTTIFSLARSQS